ncbi:hypothetical protein SpiGrapes_3107 [Sphaerochaeta pleomorpha str. Grapes]|uniref:Metal-dependent phosphoesterase, PHP family n=1 Tax=Sphaerochaeta pleomorpha (strain ATCC BAA-1885 / DSM 22778 / Grapes) TaxID=158190 RepID=G8QYZ5_SPHPG|nr:PHP domain-containing protein [Sphaerochaeta pleomorpha]AEV30854.1 hypothetical protein SpiGrapes_3107 [Sphaerochaeta pleomorpha str. Grapes]
MKGFAYETHLHTKEGSACSSCPASTYVPLFKNLGYAGIIVTDHFFNGNCTVPHWLCWEEKVNQFFLGYEKAKKLGDEIGLQVFFGWESTNRFDDYLVYGLDKTWLLGHPQVVDWSPSQIFEATDAEGGCVVHAHPFREQFFITEIKLYPECIHAVEVSNGANEIDFDRRALSYAQAFDFPMTSGSDLHHGQYVAMQKRGVVFEKKWESIQDYCQAIRERKPYSLITTEERYFPLSYKTSSVPITMYGRNNEILFQG